MQLAREYPVAVVCAVWGLARSTYYYQPQRPDDPALRTTLAALAATWPTYGSRRLTAQLRREGWTVNRKHVVRLMHELGLVARSVRTRVRTTNSRHPFGRYPNRVQNLVVTQPDHVWVCDLTYIKVRHEFVYLAVLMDVYTRCIRGWHLGRALDANLTLTALERALRTGRPAIHHSDQGVQYAAQAYVARLAAAGVQISMASVGEPTENGYAERLMRTMVQSQIINSA
jgi:transposase InsO family protein